MVGKLTVLSSSLEDSTNNHDNGTKDDCPSATPSIGDKWDERETKDSAQAVRGAEKTKQGATGLVEVQIPVGNSLET